MTWCLFVSIKMFSNQLIVYHKSNIMGQCAVEIRFQHTFINIIHHTSTITESGVIILLTVFENIWSTPARINLIPEFAQTRAAISIHWCLSLICKVNMKIIEFLLTLKWIVRTHPLRWLICQISIEWLKTLLKGNSCSLVIEGMI